MFDKVIQNDKANLIIEETHNKREQESQSEQLADLTGGKRRAEQHVLVPESVTIAQYLNSEFQHVDYLNSRFISAQMASASYEMMTPFNIKEAIQDKEGQ